MQCGPGEDWIEGKYEFDEFYISENKIPIDKPPRPSKLHTFDYTTKQWVDERTTEQRWGPVRLERDRLLQASDWTQLPDVAIETKEAWAAYRQALRDITEQSDPEHIVWPVRPT